MKFTLRGIAIAILTVFLVSGDAVTQQATVADAMLAALAAARDNVPSGPVVLSAQSDELRAVLAGVARRADARAVMSRSEAVQCPKGKRSCTVVDAVAAFHFQAVEVKDQHVRVFLERDMPEYPGGLLKGEGLIVTLIRSGNRWTVISVRVLYQS